MSAVPLKIFGCLLLVAAAFSTGALLSKRLYRRRDFLNRFKTFLQALKTQLRFHGGDIFSLVNSCIGQSQLPMMFVSDEKPFEICWNEAAECIPRSFSLTGNDLSLIHI